jgi:hypothetical protein
VFHRFKFFPIDPILFFFFVDKFSNALFLLRLPLSDILSLLSYYGTVLFSAPVSQLYLISCVFPDQRRRVKFWYHSFAGKVEVTAQIFRYMTYVCGTETCL